MLKTIIDKPGNPIKALTVLGILGGYIKNPFWFLITTSLTMRGFKKRIPQDLLKDFLKQSHFRPGYTCG
jgi:hypothetical protein